MVGLEAWILALVGEDDDGAVGAADKSRRLGATDDAVTQILWRAAKSVALARLGETEEADPDLRGVHHHRRRNDSFDAENAWLARAMVLSLLGRRGEAVAAASDRGSLRPKGFVDGIRRAQALIVEWSRRRRRSRSDTGSKRASMTGWSGLMYAVADGRIDLIHTKVFPSTKDTASPPR